jgi:hypothetical protein
MTFFRRLLPNRLFSQFEFTSETTRAVQEGRTRLAEKIAPLLEKIIKNPSDNNGDTFNNIALFLPAKSRDVLEDALTRGCFQINTSS